MDISRTTPSRELARFGLTSAQTSYPAAYATGLLLARRLLRVRHGAQHQRQFLLDRWGPRDATQRLDRCAKRRPPHHRRPGRRPGGESGSDLCVVGAGRLRRHCFQQQRPHLGDRRLEKDRDDVAGGASFGGALSVTSRDSFEPASASTGQCTRRSRWRA